MKKVIAIYIVCLSALACAKEDYGQKVPEDAVSDVNMQFNATIAGTNAAGLSRAYGDTGYEVEKFAAADQIGIYVTRTRRDGQPAGIADIYAQYSDMCYSISAAGVWSLKDYAATESIKVPMFSTTHLDVYAYYPAAARAQTTAGTNIIQNGTDPNKITFRIYQAQTPENLGLCNIMRAQCLDRSYPRTPTTPADLQFKHILALIEFKICKDNTVYYKDDQSGEVDPDATWGEDDMVFLKNVVVLGSKVSTEGTFDLMGPDPNVQILSSSLSRGSVYKKDSPTGTALKTFDGSNIAVDATSGATMRRHIIIPPVPYIDENEPDPDPEKGEQGSMEIMLELEWIPAGATERIATNRHFIVKGMEFASGKRYIVYLLVKRQKPSGLQKITTVNCMPVAWTTKDWAVTFN